MYRIGRSPNLAIPRAYLVDRFSTMAV